MTTVLYNLPPWLLLLLAIAGASALACGALVGVRRTFPRTDFSAHNEVAGIVLGIVGGLFGVMLAFIVAIVWQEFDAASQRVAVEVGAATDLWHVSAGFPAPLMKDVRTFESAYARAMLDDEWPAMRHGGSSARAEAMLTDTYEEIARFRPADDGADNAQSAALGYFGTLHDARHHRLDDNASGVSGFEWSILLLCAAFVVGLSTLVGTPDLRAQLVMTAVVAATIAALFVLVVELDYPFRGDIAISPDAWREFSNARP